MKKVANKKTTLLDELEFLLKKGNAHVPFNEAVKDLPFEDLGKKPQHLPYSIWQLTEHIRITQKDILDFCVNDNYKELNWPNDYWPAEDAPKSEEQWKKTVQQINDDLTAFIHIIKTSVDIYEPFTHGNGQSLFREALVIADHNSYHTGEIILLRRLLGNWKKK